MLVHTFPPFGTVGGSIRLVKFLRYMDRTAWAPTLITIDPEVDLLWLPKDSSFSLDEVPGDIQVIRTDTGEPKDPKFKSDFLRNIFRRLKLALLLPVRRFLLIPDDKKQWSSNLIEAATKELESNKYSLIYATAPPFSVLLAAAKLKDRFDLPLVIDIKDDWLVKERFLGLKKFRRLIEPSLEKRCIDAADKVITVTQLSYDEYSARYPEHLGKFELIHNGCDIQEYRKYWNSRPEKFDKFTFIHTGVLSAVRDMSALYKALKRVIDERGAEEKFQFIILGNVPTNQKNMIRGLGLTNIVKFMPYMDRDEYVETLVKSHMPVVINYSVPSLIPGKLYEYWGSRNKMLLLDSDESAAADIVRRYEIGSVIKPDDEEAMYKLIGSAFEDWEVGKTELSDISKLHLFDRSSLTRKLESVFSTSMNMT
jgi:glycosyltransferase involved in cell wall biosynthesis